MKSLGPSAPAASAAWAGNTPGPSLLPGRRPWPRGSKTLKFQVVFLLLNFINTVTANPIGDHPADPQRVEQSPSEGTCTPGYHLSVENGACMPCKDGIDYTSSSNKLPSCMPCSVCKEDKDEKSKCTTTNNTECQCKRGTFEDENSPESCQKCSEYGMGPWNVYKPGAPQKTQTSLCTNEENEVTTCTPKTNRKCVYKGPYLGLFIGPFVFLGLLIFAIAIIVSKTRVWRKVLQCVKGAHPGCEWDSENLNITHLSLRGKTSTVGKDSHYSPAAKAPEEPEVAENSPMGRQLLAPENENDSVDDKDIQMVRAATQVPKDTLYQMLMKWLDQTGRSASINNLLDALEATGERYTRDTIEDHEVKSGKFIHQKATAEPAMTPHNCDTGTEESEAG